MQKNWKEEQKQRRDQLKELSNSLKPLVDAGDFETLNAALVAYYKQQHPEIIEFHTFHDWKHQGATIRKGEKAFIIWGQPRKLSSDQEANQTPGQEELEDTFFPICCLFANTQVITAEAREQHRATVKTPESGHAHPIVQEAEALPF